MASGASQRGPLVDEDQPADPGLGGQPPDVERPGHRRTGRRREALLEVEALHHQRVGAAASSSTSRHGAVSPVITIEPAAVSSAVRQRVEPRLDVLGPRRRDPPAVALDDRTRREVAARRTRGGRRGSVPPRSTKAVVLSGWLTRAIQSWANAPVRRSSSRRVSATVGGGP